MAILASMLICASLGVIPVPASDRVEALYAAFPWEGESVLNADRETLQRYFDDELIALLEADAACTERTEGICNLGSDPIYNAQDAEISGLRVSGGAQADVVYVRFLNFGEEQQLLYRMRHSEHGWRIHDIEYGEGHSLRGWLSEPIP